MGLLDNTLQRESKVVTVSNCSNSEGKLARFSMENDRRTGLPKSKRRSVSVVREFPPGCGRTISLIKDEAVSISRVTNSGDLTRNGDAEGDLLEQPKILENSGPTTTPAESKVAPGNGIESHLAKTSEDMASTEQSDCFESAVEAPAEQENWNPEPVEVSFPGGPYSSSTCGDIEELKSSDHETVTRNNIFPPKYPPRRKVSAVRVFPPFCGRNAAPVIDAQNDDNILNRFAFTLIEPNVHPESEGLTTKNRRYSKKEMEMTQPDLLEQEIVQNQRKGNNRVSEDIVSTPLVVGLMAAGTGPWVKEKKVQTLNGLSGSTSESKQTNDNISHKTYVKAKKKTNAEKYGRIDIKEKKKMIKNSQSIDVTLPPSFIRSSDGNDGGVTRSKVRETLRLF